MRHTPDTLLTAEQLAERWQLPGKQAVYRMAREGTIPPGAVVRLGRYVRFSLPGIEDFERVGGGMGRAGLEPATGRL